MINVNPVQVTLFSFPICKMGTVKPIAIVNIHYNKHLYNGFLAQKRVPTHRAGCVSHLRYNKILTGQRNLSVFCLYYIKI